MCLKVPYQAWGVRSRKYKIKNNKIMGGNYLLDWENNNKKKQKEKGKGKRIPVIRKNYNLIFFLNDLFLFF